MIMVRDLKEIAKIANEFKLIISNTDFSDLVNIYGGIRFWCCQLINTVPPGKPDTDTAIKELVHGVLGLLDDYSPKIANNLRSDQIFIDYANKHRNDSWSSNNTTIKKPVFFSMISAIDNAKKIKGDNLLLRKISELKDIPKVGEMLLGELNFEYSFKDVDDISTSFKK